VDVLFLAPAYPTEMRRFTRGFAEVGARVWGVGDTPAGALPEEVRSCLSGYLHVPRIMDEADVIQRVEAWLGDRRPDRIESLWEPLVLLAARLRDRLGVPGMSHDTVLGFRDKQLMKERVAAAGLRVPHSRRVRKASEIWEAAEQIGYPLILKPIAGAGSADTYRVDDARQLASVLERMGHVKEASCEEFVDGEEFTYDTVCINGRPAYENVAQYLPRPLIARTNEWISPVIITVRDMQQPKIRAGVELGRNVLKALGMGTGFTHMEWYRKSNGEVVFGEIGCRPGGAHLVDQMNFTSDISLYRECARAICWGAFDADATRRFNTAIVFKRAMGKGRIRAVTGLEGWKQRCGRWVAAEELLPVGANRRDWLQTLVSDGFVIVRHPDWDTAHDMAFDAATHIQMYATPD
jgi:biotin carboxylase